MTLRTFIHTAILTVGTAILVPATATAAVISWDFTADGFDPNFSQIGVFNQSSATGTFG